MVYDEPRNIFYLVFIDCVLPALPRPMVGSPCLPTPSSCLFKLEESKCLNSDKASPLGMRLQHAGFVSIISITLHECFAHTCVPQDMVLTQKAPFNPTLSKVNQDAEYDFSPEIYYQQLISSA